MRELKTLFRQSSHYVVGRVGVFLVGLISFPLFTRLLTVSDYGVMSLILKVIGVVAVLSKLGMQNSLLRFWDEHAASREPERLRRFFSSLFFGTAGTAVAATLLFVFGVWAMPGALVSQTMKQLLLFGSALIFIRGMFSLLAAFLRVEEKTKAYNVLDVAQKAGTILTTCVFFFAWRPNAWAFVAGTLLVEGLVVLVMTLSLLRRGRLQPKLFDATLFRGALLFGLPLVVYEFASVILDSGDRILVQHYLGPVQLGYYSAVYNISTYLETAITVPLNLALFPIYIKLWVNKGKAETQAFLSRSLDLFLFLIIGVLVAVILTSGDAVTVLASSKYREAHGLLPVLVAGLLLYAVHIFLSAGLLIFKKTFTAARMVVYACVLNIVMNIVLIPRMGIFAAALATLVSYGFLVLILGHASFRVLPFKIEYGAIARYLLAGTVTTAFLWRLDLGSSLLNLSVKGCLGLMLYAGTIWLIDPRARHLYPQIWGAVRQRLGKNEGTPLTDAAPLAKD